jgi:hypothetical protein
MWPMYALSSNSSPISDPSTTKAKLMTLDTYFAVFTRILLGTGPAPNHIYPHTSNDFPMRCSVQASLNVVERGPLLNTSRHRHFSAAISRAYIPHISPFFERDIPACEEVLVKNTNKEWAQRMQAAQTNHSFLTSIRHYGTEDKFHPDVQRDHSNSFAYLSYE